MKPQLHQSYTRSSIRRKMASPRKSGRSAIGEASERAIQEEDRWPWMDVLQAARSFGDERESHEAQGERQRIAKSRSTTPVRGSTPEQKFEELISAIHSMTGMMHSMQRQMVRHWGESKGIAKQQTLQPHTKRDLGGLRQDQGERCDIPFVS